MGKRWNHPVREKIEEVFCTGRSGFTRPAYTYNEGDKEKGLPRIIETQKFNSNGKKLTEDYLGNTVVVNIRPNKKIKAFCLDIDRGSKYRFNYDGILHCLEEIGIVRYIKVISSSNNGLHIWFPLKEEVNSRFLHVAIKAWLIENEFEVRDGVLELWPDKNSTTYKSNIYGRKETEHLAKCFRLPCQDISYVVREDEGFEHDSIERFWLYDFDWCATKQDYETFYSYKQKIEADFDRYVWQDDVLVPLEEAGLKTAEFDVSNEVEASVKPKKKNKKRGGHNSRVNQELNSLKQHLDLLDRSPRTFIKRLRQIVKEGWTQTSYSNFLIGAVAILTSYDNRDYDVQELAQVIRWEAMRLPGYKELASPESKKDLASVSQRSWCYRWAKSVIKYRSKLNQLKNRF